MNSRILIIVCYAALLSLFLTPLNYLNTAVQTLNLQITNFYSKKHPFFTVTLTCSKEASEQQKNKAQPKSLKRVGNQKTKLVMKNPVSTSPFVEAEQIIEELKNEATSLLSGVLNTPLVPLTITNKGNFPYYWQNPSNLQFNAKTYDWIASNLKANTSPIQLDQYFTNIYIQALSKVVYVLSSADQAALNTAQQNATNQQVALLNAWKQAYGSLPPATPKMQPIDIIMNTIATEWANPKTTLYDIQQSKNLNKLLNNTPASGKPILPVLANYLNALGSSITLQNAVTMNNGYISQALDNVQNPSADNGGLTLDSNKIVPAFQVTTQLSDILNGLKNTSQAADLELSISRETSDEFSVSVNGSTGFSIPILDLFTIGVGGNAKYFSDHIATTKNTISVSMKFTGVTLVNFGPLDYSMSTGLNWSWFSPINEAIRNTDKDVTGFKFSPNPNIDFSENGPFGLLNGVAISNYPNITIKVTSDEYESIAKSFEQSTSVKISFLGIPLASASESTYSASTSVDSKSQEVTITLTPPQELIAGTSVDSMGWVLGVAADYPADGGEDYFEMDEMLGKGGYPGYQLYEDNTGATYCSKNKVKSHAEGNLWVKACIKAHPGTSCSGKPWISDSQSGTIWP